EGLECAPGRIPRYLITERGAATGEWSAHERLRAAGLIRIDLQPSHLVVVEGVDLAVAVREGGQQAVGGVGGERLVVEGVGDRRCEVRAGVDVDLRLPPKWAADRGEPGRVVDGGDVAVGVRDRVEPAVGVVAERVDRASGQGAARGQVAAAGVEAEQLP